MKLKQFLSNQFNKARLFFNERKYFKILDQHIGEIFPMQADIDKNLKKLLQNHKTKNMQNIDVLVDGEFVERLKDITLISVLIACTAISLFFSLYHIRPRKTSP